MRIAVKGTPEGEKGIEWEKERNTVREDVAKEWTFETGKVENDRKNTDWSKDGGDKFYSLMEESEAVSSGCNLSEEDRNASSIAKSLSSAVGPTVRPQRRQRKRIKSRIGAGVIGDSPGECAETLRWDYSGIRLSQPRKHSKVPKDTSLILNSTEGENITDGQTNNMASADTKQLHLIYGTVRELQTETWAENRRARMANKQLQVAVCKIAKYCAEIEEKLNSVESRTSVVEGEVVALKEHVETQGGQLTDAQACFPDIPDRAADFPICFTEKKISLKTPKGSIITYRKTETSFC
ncbi:hypothetical protein NDU88_003822 [Pleurodeles waltl]|uniref:Uncharacterized protein n=1 Tax=Pleurodeles waltl TaxID=8319 RepID=A0AAV7KWP3_PLEWA|nr:hypothetical protein NDU88_003822 [Pleurodeles waltl]